MRTETRVTASIVLTVSFSITGGDDDLYEAELWNHCRIQTTALGRERTGEDDDVKEFFCFSAAHGFEHQGVKISWGS